MKIKEQAIYHHLYFIFLPIIILWQMLLPGYVLTLDMIFTPEIKVFFGDGSFVNSLPLQYFLKLINIFLDGWMVQELLLVLLFFLLAYLPYKFLNVPDRYGAKYFASLIYVINPFVYERFLAGQIAHLFAYAFFPPIVFHVQRYLLKYNKKDFLLLVLWLVLQNVFSLHLSLMSLLGLALIIFVDSAVKLIRRKYSSFKKNIFSGLALIVVLLAFFSYWILPYIISQENNILESIASDQIQAFSAAGDERFGVILNLVGLYGYWGENQPWAQQFLWAKGNTIFWTLTLLMLLTVVIVGIAKSIKANKENFLMLFVLLLSIVFASGASDTIFKTFNNFLYDHISFWSGFRDSTKFISLTALTYAYFGGWGIYAIGEWLTIKHKNLKKYLLALFLIPIFYSFPMLGGFTRQLSPVPYPDSWEMAEQILSEEAVDTKVLFLPWHGYMSFPFNNNLLTANPAKFYFSNDIIQANSMDMAGVKEVASYSSGDLDRIIRSDSRDLTKNEINSVLKRKNIHYIIMSSNLQGIDDLKYDFLSMLDYEEIFNSRDLTIYHVVLN